jgi:hypothetical protein
MYRPRFATHATNAIDVPDFDQILTHQGTHLDIEREEFFSVEQWPGGTNVPRLPKAERITVTGPDENFWRVGGCWTCEGLRLPCRTPLWRFIPGGRLARSPRKLNQVFTFQLSPRRARMANASSN